MNTFSEKFAEYVNRVKGTPSLTNRRPYDKGCRQLAYDLDSVLSCIIDDSNGSKTCENEDIKKIVDKGQKICEQDSVLKNILIEHRNRHSSTAITIISNAALLNWTKKSFPSKLAPDMSEIGPDDRVRYCKFILRMLAGVLKLTEDEERQLIDSYDTARGCGPNTLVPPIVPVQPPQKHEIPNAQAVDQENTPEIPLPPTPSQFLHKKYAIFTAIVSIVIMLMVWFFSTMFSHTKENQEFNIQILYPATNMKCPHYVPIYGIIKNLPSSKQLWIVKEPTPSEGNYHPDRGPLRVKKGGEFFGAAYIGSATIGGDIGRMYTVHLVVTSYEAGRRFNDYLAEAHKTNGWTGLPSILDGKVVASFNVIRDDSAKCEYQDADKFV